ncbi:MFS transporter [Chengkuizengella axinellae]|uniref:MFS transporter n=1 Tax=Chengkuizengella axinellae TaxID=3064388 RepID=A0ABT9IUD9_9BACL|nr:MFS transporter [Chengkuizengella sp. 2205SS18-9]MDP5272943.1 MFS transporter [Chengkuizengella sp. 2205SS18-9]
MKNTNVYSNLLRRNKQYKKLFLAQATSTIGDWFSTIALLTFVYGVTESPLMVSLTLISKGLPQLLFSPFAGVFIDRTNRKKILIITDMIRAVIVLGLLFAEAFVYIVFIVNALMAICSTLFNPARQSVIPKLVKKEHLPVANSLSSSMQAISAILGSSIGGIALGFLSPNIAFVLNSMTFIISALFIKYTVIPQAEKKQEATKIGYFKDMVDGYKFIIQTPIILGLILVGMSWGIVGGVYQILLTIYGSDVYQLGNNGIGILYAIQGLGVLIGSVFVAKYMSLDTERMKKYFGWSYLLQGIFFILFALSVNLFVGILFLLLMRIAGGIIIPLDSTLIQTYSPDDQIGKVFTLHYAVYGSLFQLSMFLTGVLLDYYSPQVIGVVFGIICVFTSSIWLVLLYQNKLVAYR